MPSSTPSFARRPARARANAWQWSLLTGLSLLLALQILVADRAQLASNAHWRPLLETLCATLGCTLPAWHEPAAFHLLRRDVRSLPARPGVLQVTASFRNEARWAQRWPWLELSLSDTNGHIISTGVFQPKQYLGQAIGDGDTLHPGQSAQIAFEVREPPASTTAFTLDFR